MRRIDRTTGMLLVGGIVLPLAVALVAFPGIRVQPRQASVDPARAQIQATLTQLPLSFEVNRGQSDSRVKFLSRGIGYTLFLTPNEAVFILQKIVATDVPQQALRMKLAGAQPALQVEGLEALPGKSNYFIGNDPGRWHTNVPTFARVRYRSVYPGIDLVYYGNQRQLEHDFLVAPGADPSAITIDFEGAETLSVDGQGELVATIPGGQVRLRRPAIYQEVGGVRRDVAGGYVLKDPHTVGFHIAAYDAGRPLIIDPVLVYSTYLGGSDIDQGFAIAVDSAGNAYVTGGTSSTNFPTAAGAVQTAYRGGVRDTFVTKLNAAGTALVYSTYLGGSDNDQGFGIAVDSAGDAYVTGLTVSTNFPTTSGTLQAASGGGQDGFVTRLNATGTALVYSTYLGGSGGDQGLGIAVDSVGDAYLTGFTGSTNFPTTGGAFQTTFRAGVHDAFVSKLSTTGTALVYSTYLGGTGIEQGLGIAVDSAGDAYVTGFTGSTNFPTTSGAVQAASGGIRDVFVTRLNATGTALAYSTYLGGNDIDQGFGIAVDSAGDAYVTGLTLSTNFPTTGGAVQTAYRGNADAFVSKLNATGTALPYSTYLGGSSTDQGYGIGVDSDGNAYVTGLTASANFPTTDDAFQTTAGGSQDAFVAELNGAGEALVYSTYLGGGGTDHGRGIAVNAAGEVYVLGLAASAIFPTTVGAVQTTPGGSADAFVARISPVPPVSPTTTTLASSANPSLIGQSVTFTATVSPSAAIGTVTFRDGTTVLETATLASGQAALTTSTLDLGSHSIRAEYSGSANFSPSTGNLTQQVTYGICVLYDQTKSVKSGAVFPIKVALCDVNGTNLSSSAIVLHATAVTMVSGFTGEPESPGNANPDNDFRFDSTLAVTGGYIFNLSTQGLAGGTYRLQFSVTGDPVTHAVSFGVK